jgi:hypothetical protein
VTKKLVTAAERPVDDPVTLLLLYEDGVVLSDEIIIIVRDKIDVATDGSCVVDETGTTRGR